MGGQCSHLFKKELMIVPGCFGTVHSAHVQPCVSWLEMVAHINFSGHGHNRKTVKIHSEVTSAVLAADPRRAALKSSKLWNVSE
jgi:hypothetical protein